MLNTIPPDPEPTDAEIEEILDRNKARWTGEDRYLKIFARLSWKVDLKRRDENAFLVPFATEVPGYETYLQSDLWADIRARVIRAAGGNCPCCPRRASEVHHRDYRPRVLSGEDLTPLVAICKPCHKKVHYDGRKKRESWNETEAVLAEMVAQRRSGISI